MKRFYLILALLLVTSAYAATPNPGHDAARIGPGAFAEGDFTFNGTLRIMNTTNYTLFTVNTATGVITINGSIVSSGGNARGYGANDLQVFRSANSQVASGNFSVIGGGANNTVTNSFGVIVGGRSNQVTGDYGVAVGGFQSLSSNTHAVVLGGNSNTASGQWSTVIGGSQNTASGSLSIAGGNGLTASSTSSIALGGQTNWATATFSTVIGGSNNNAAGTSSAVIGGGSNNASGQGAFVAGGDRGNASGQYSAVLSGANNNATGARSATIAGTNLVAQAYGSVAIGRFNTPQGTMTSWVRGDRAFIIGNGTNDTNLDNAFYVTNNGTVWTGGAMVTPTLCLNGDCRTSWPTAGASSSGSGWANTTELVSLSTSSNNVSANTLFVDNTNSRVGIGTTAPIGKFNIYNGHFEFQSALDGADAYDTYYKRAHAGPAAVNSGDEITSLYFQGYNGSDYLNAARIEGAVDGSPGNADMPGRLAFYTASDGSATPAERMRIDSNGNIGIGTSTPGTALHINRSAGPVAINLSAGNYGSNRGLILLDSAALGFYTGTSTLPAMYILHSSGNVGIGTTTPNGKFEVFGNATGGTTVGDFVVDTANKTVYVGRLSSTAGDTSKFVIRARDGTEDFVVDHNNAQAYFFAGGMSVAINGTSPTSTLQVTGTANISNRIYTPEICLNGVCSSSWAGGVSSAGGWTNTTTVVSLSNSANNISAGALTVDNTNSRVGIATSAQGAPLSVGGTAVAFGTAALHFDYNSGAARIASGATGNASLALLTTLNGGATERIRIDQAGRVGIGTTAPTYRLDIHETSNGTGSSYALRVNSSGRTIVDFTSPTEHVFLNLDSAHDNTYLPIVSFKRLGVTYANIGLERQSNSGGDGSNYEESQMSMGTMTEVPVSFKTNGTRRLTVAANGNVGIGTPTPSVLLHINSSGVNGAHIYFQSADTGGRTWDIISTGSNNGGGAGNLHFYDSSNSVLFLRGGGGVGVGTTAPISSLHVKRFAGSNSSALFEGDSGVTGAPKIHFIDTVGAGVLNSSVWTLQDDADVFTIGRSVNHTASLTSMVTIANNASIGINDTTPMYTLDVGGAAQIQTQLTTPQLCLNGDCRTSWPAINGASASGGWTNTTTLVSLSTSTNNVSIGASSGGAKLEVNSATAGAEVARFEGAYAASGNVDLATFRRNGGAVAAAMRYVDADTDLSFGTTTAHRFNIMTGGADRITVSSSGDLGINTTSPGYRLDAFGPLGAEVFFDLSNENPKISLRPGTGGSDPAIQWYTSAGVLKATIDAADTGLAIINNQNAPIFFRTNGTDERLHISADGKIGIGTEYPATLFHINGTSPEFRIDFKNNTDSAIFRFAADGATKWKITADGSDLSSSGYPKLKFWAQGGYEPLTLSDDNVGINSSTPYQKLHITTSGTSGFTGGVNRGILLTDNTGPRIVFEDSGENAGDKVMMMRYENQNFDFSSLTDNGGAFDSQGILKINRDGNVTASIRLITPEICLNGVCSSSWTGGVSSAGGWTNTSVQTRTGLNVSVDTNVLFVDTTNDKVGIGSSSPTQALHVVGNANITGNVYYGGNLTGYGADFAERMTVAEPVEATDVVCLRTDGKIEQCSEHAQNAVVGVVSTFATIIGNGAAPNSVPVGIVGIVPTKVVGPVNAFDLLTTSTTEGHAEKAGSEDFGAIVGKAMESCDKDACVINVLVGLR